jgi:hypothetical protein
MRLMGPVTRARRSAAEKVRSSDLSGQQQVPRLAGQDFDYLLKLLRGFKAKTASDLDGTMTVAAQPLRKEDIDSLVHFMAGFLVGLRDLQAGRGRRGRLDPGCSVATRGSRNRSARPPGALSRVTGAAPCAVPCTAKAPAPFTHSSPVEVFAAMHLTRRAGGAG